MTSQPKSLTLAYELESNGSWRQARRVASQVLRRSSGVRRAEAHLLIAKLDKYRGHFRGSIDRLEKAKKIFAENHEVARAQSCRLQQGINWQYLGDYTLASAILHDLLQSARIDSDVYLESHCTLQLGILHRILYEFSSALKFLARSWCLKRRIADDRDLASAIEQTGIVRERMGEVDVAHKLYVEVYKIRRRIGYRRGIGTYFLRRAVLCRRTREFLRGKRYLSKSLAIRSSIGDTIGIGSCLHEWAVLELETGCLALAESLAKRALSIRSQLRDLRRLANTNTLLARIQILAGNTSNNKYILASERLWRKIDNPVRLIETLRLKSKLLGDSRKRLDSLDTEIRTTEMRLSKEQIRFYVKGPE